MSATSVILSNPVVTVNTVDLTEQCTAAALVRTRPALDVTSFGDDSRRDTGGLWESELTLTLYMSYAATNVYATLKSLVGTTTTVTLKPTSSATSATNPLLTLADCYLESLPVLNAELGAISTIDVVFRNGTFSEATS